MPGNEGCDESGVLQTRLNCGMLPTNHNNTHNTLTHSLL